MTLTDNPSRGPYALQGENRELFKVPTLEFESGMCELNLGITERL